MKKIILLLFLSFILTGCNLPGQKKSEETAKKFLGGVINKTTGGRLKISEDGQKVSLKNKQGEEMVIGQKELVMDLPDDISVYPGASVKSSWQTDEEGRGIMAEFVTNDSLAEVESFYRDELTQEGWQETNRIDQEDSIVFIAEKNNRSAWISLNQIDSQVKINILISAD